jgi:hypothetical protein
MPVIQAQCASILVPHDHRHINHERMTKLALPGRPQNRKRVRPPGSAAKVTIAERGSMRYTFHGGGPCDGALNGAVMPGPLSSGSAGQPLSAHAFAMRATAPGSVTRASRAVRARAHRHLGQTPTASHIRSRRRSPALPTRRWHSGTPAAPTRPTCCGTDLGTRPLAKQIAQLAPACQDRAAGQPATAGTGASPPASSRCSGSSRSAGATARSRLSCSSA